jgi:o-succinylbenzoate---CoA ligase
MESIPHLLQKRAYLTPNRTAFYFNDQEVTFKEVYLHSLSIAEKFTTLGIKKGDYVAILLKNHLDMVYVLFGLQLTGASAVLLNIRLTSNEIAWQLKDANVKLLITEEKLAPIYSELEDTTYILKQQLSLINQTAFTRQEEIYLNDICSVMYTSGTTGNPKGVLQTYANHWWSAMGSALNLGLNEKDRWICTVPLFHISGYSILMRGIIYGMAVILHEGFDEAKIVNDIVNKKGSIISVVSTMVPRILEHLGNQTLPNTFRCMLVGGGPVPKSLLEACVEKHIPIYQTYGMTETASQVVTLTPEDSLIKLGSAGKPLFPVQLKIKNTESDEAKPMESGEIIIKAPNVTIGYLNQPGVTSEKIQNGWLHTGDIGYLDEDGFLYVQDRRSDLIISGGENIYPAEIEGILLSHPEVVDAGVIGIKDPVWGQVPVAIAVKKTNSLINSAGLQNFCQENLAKYKVPKKIVFTNALPRNAAKKLMRHKLRDWWKEHQSNDESF